MGNALVLLLVEDFCYTKTREQAFSRILKPKLNSDPLQIADCSRWGQGYYIVQNNVMLMLDERITQTVEHLMLMAFPSAPCCTKQLFTCMLISPNDIKLVSTLPVTVVNIRGGGMWVES